MEQFKSVKGQMPRCGPSADGLRELLGQRQRWFSLFLGFALGAVGRVLILPTAIFEEGANSLAPSIRLGLGIDDAADYPALLHPAHRFQLELAADGRRGRRRSAVEHPDKSSR
ncbi:hypothetical protein PT015_23240 [Candidatus Mycobacterium wuenschmannii]|uniref:Uncharacterized protein n=1 Tax=Candidatus Mycobacterium wuenschmannii TaxID=3027808 RepID=A0ABY8VVN0_9MYCO|nr:hypothetical protein [Candidatus Mycobacterium wuenschmannii]WIM87709.1 hypothetical protein PT015_23240 [Candidatus Mycobacterium wuenschmannii]